MTVGRLAQTPPSGVCELIKGLCSRRCGEGSHCRADWFSLPDTEGSQLLQPLRGTADPARAGPRSAAARMILGGRAPAAGRPSPKKM